MENKRLLVPGALNRFDNWLLMNKPETWSARTHLVIYFTGLLILIIGISAYVIPDDPRLDSSAEYWLMLTPVFSCIALIIWLVYLLRFNVFKRYGNSNGTDRLETFLLYFISTAFIVAVPFIQPIVESAKANTAFPDAEMIKDVDRVNVIINQLEYKNLNHTWARDTFTVRDTLPTVTRIIESTYDDGSQVYISADTLTETEPGLIGIIDTADLKTRLLYADSIIRMNDSMYIFLEVPNYIFLNGNDIGGPTKYTMSALEIYEQVIRNYRPVDRQVVSAELRQLVEKYKYPMTFSPYYNGEPLLNIIEKRYNIKSMRESIDNITNRKYLWDNGGKEIAIRVFLYVTAVISLLVFTFRHSTAKTFFLTLLALALIAILSSVLLAMLNPRPPSFMIVMLSWFAIFTLTTIILWYQKKRNAIVGIGINLFTMCVAFVPLMIVGLCLLICEETQRKAGIYEDDKEILNLLEFWIPVAEIAGALIFLLLVGTYINRLYRKWYSLPED